MGPRLLPCRCRRRALPRWEWILFLRAARISLLEAEKKRSKANSLSSSTDRGIFRFLQPHRADVRGLLLPIGEGRHGYIIPTITAYENQLEVKNHWCLHRCFAPVVVANGTRKKYMERKENAEVPG